MVMGTSWYQAAYLHTLGCPVRIVEPETGDFVGAQTSGNQYHESGPAAGIARPVAYSGCKQVHDLTPV